MCSFYFILLKRAFAPQVEKISSIWLELLRFILTAHTIFFLFLTVTCFLWFHYTIFAGTLEFIVLVINAVLPETFIEAFFKNFDDYVAAASVGRGYFKSAFTARFFSFFERFFILVKQKNRLNFCFIYIFFLYYMSAALAIFYMPQTTVKFFDLRFSLFAYIIFAIFLYFAIIFLLFAFSFVANSLFPSIRYKKSFLLTNVFFIFLILLSHFAGLGALFSELSCIANDFFINNFWGLGTRKTAIEVLREACINFEKLPRSSRSTFELYQSIVERASLDKNKRKFFSESFYCDSSSAGDEGYIEKIYNSVRLHQKTILMVVSFTLLCAGGWIFYQYGGGWIAAAWGWYTNNRGVGAIDPVGARFKFFNPSNNPFNSIGTTTLKSEADALMELQQRGDGRGFLNYKQLTRTHFNNTDRAIKYLQTKNPADIGAHINALLEPTVALADINYDKATFEYVNYLMTNHPRDWLYYIFNTPEAGQYLNPRAEEKTIRPILKAYMEYNNPTNAHFYPYKSFRR